MIKYGLISETDARTLEKTIDLICNDFLEEEVKVCEVGVYAGDTGFGITEYLIKSGKDCFLIGVENNRDGEKIRTVYDKMIYGNSNEVYNQLEDESQHLIFIDGCHTFPAVVADFFCYAPKVKVGGFLAFHDTGVHIDKLHGWQGVGDKNDPDFCLGGVRKALNEVGILYDESPVIGAIINQNNLCKWELVFDEADPNDEAGGICVFKKLY